MASTLGSGSTTSERTLSFEEFYNMRDSQRHAGFNPGKKKKKGTPANTAVKNVEIKVGLAQQITDGVIKTRRGKTHVITYFFISV